MRDESMKAQAQQYANLPADQMQTRGLGPNVPFLSGLTVMQRHYFTSGATSSEESARFDLLALTFLQRTAAAMAEGERLHGRFNYRKAVGDADYHRDCANHIVTHMLLWIAGDRSEDHLSHAAARINILMDLEQLGSQNGDTSATDTVR